MKLPRRNGSVIGEGENLRVMAEAYAARQEEGQNESI